MTDVEMAAIRVQALDRVHDARFDNIADRLTEADKVAVWLSTGELPAAPAPTPETTP